MEMTTWPCFFLKGSFGVDLLKRSVALNGHELQKRTSLAVPSVSHRAHLMGPFLPTRLIDGLDTLDKMEKELGLLGVAG